MGAGVMMLSALWDNIEDQLDDSVEIKEVRFNIEVELRPKRIR
jgi:hypothetical protein